jgi:hypothetical protein
MSEALSLSKPTVHGLVRTLLARGFVTQDPESKKYQMPSIFSVTAGRIIPKCFSEKEGNDYVAATLNSILSAYFVETSLKTSLNILHEENTHESNRSDFTIV